MVVLVVKDEEKDKKKEKYDEKYRKDNIDKK